LLGPRGSLRGPERASELPIELTLINGDERFRELVGQQSLRQLPEILFHKIGNVVRLLPVEVDVVALRLRHDLELLYPRLDAALPEDAHLVQGVGSQPSQSDLNTLG